MGTDAYDRLLADLGSTFRPQREWVEGRGLYLIIGHFLSGVGAGTWLFAWLFEVRPGLLVGLALVALGGAAHLRFLGRPGRFYRMVRAGRSWIARGFIGMNLFLAGALLYELPRVIPGAPWAAEGPLGQIFLWLSIAGAVILIVYKGNVYAASRAIPFWNSPVLPLLYIAYALRGGAAFLLVLAPFTGGLASSDLLAVIEFWIALSAAVMVAFYLGVIRGVNVAARRSVSELTAGRVVIPFYLGTVTLGLVVPIGIGLAGFYQPLSLAVLAVVGGLSLLGDFFAKYTIARAGIYVPVLLPGVAPAVGGAREPGRPARAC
jgi:formate-dependent nitrite reductase membrane component NrfD